MDEPVPGFQETEVRETILGLFEALNSHDVEAASGFYAQDEELVHVGCTEVRLGFESNRRILRQVLGSQPDLRFDVDIVHVGLLGTKGASVIARGSTTDAPAIFWSYSLERRDGRWVVVHEHESWPGCPPPAGPHPTVDPGA